MLPRAMACHSRSSSVGGRWASAAVSYAGDKSAMREGKCCGLRCQAPVRQAVGHRTGERALRSAPPASRPRRRAGCGDGGSITPPSERALEGLNRGGPVPDPARGGGSCRCRSRTARFPKSHPTARQPFGGLDLAAPGCGGTKIGMGKGAGQAGGGQGPRQSLRACGRQAGWAVSAGARGGRLRKGPGQGTATSARPLPGSRHPARGLC